jgi:type I restriction enzyme S subunit
MSEWKEYNLNEVYDFGSGLSKGASEFGFGHGFLGFKDVFHNFFTPDELTSLVNSTEKEQENCSIKRGDVFLTRTSETDEDLGMSCVALKDYPKATFNGFTKRLRPKGNVEILPEYAGFYFRSPKFRATVSGMSSITTRASLNNGMLSELKISLPKIEEQKAIADTLNALHNKVDLLKSQNETLEELSSMIFKNLFLNENSANWEDGKINTLFDLLSGFAFKSSEYKESGNYRLVTIKNVQDGYIDLSRTDYLIELPERMPKYCALELGDILLSLTGNVGRCCLVNEENLLLNQRVAKLKPKNQRDWAFGYALFRQKSIRWQVEELAKGTAQSNLSPVETSEMQIKIPPVPLLEEYSKENTPMFKKILANHKQIKTLTKQRDNLLPKLMSQEATIEI